MRQGVVGQALIERTLTQDMDTGFQRQLIELRLIEKGDEADRREIGQFDRRLGQRPQNLIAALSFPEAEPGKQGQNHEQRQNQQHRHAGPVALTR